MLFPSESPLESALRELSDLCDDFQNAKYGNGHNALSRIVARLDSEPLASFLRERLPDVDVEAWAAEVEATRGGMVGSGCLVWRNSRAENVALTIALIRDLATSEQKVFGFTHEFTSSGYNISGDYQKFGDDVLRRMHRDIERLAEDRELPPLLGQVFGALPTSGDAKLDALLVEAVERFKDPAPQSQAGGIERLWDAFERVKTLEAADKREGTAKLLARVAPEPTFRAALDAEMIALTAIGNAFHIRHSETKQIELRSPADRDYLFHRMFALMVLLLSTRSRNASA